MFLKNMGLSSVARQPAHLRPGLSCKLLLWIWNWGCGVKAVHGQTMVRLWSDYGCSFVVSEVGPNAANICLKIMATGTLPNKF